VLPSFTTHAGVLIERVELATRPHLQRRIDAGELPDVDPRLLIDALSRVAISMVFTNGLVDLTDPDSLRGYLGAVGLILNGIRSGSTTA
jgi:hypothetical protein